MNRLTFIVALTLGLGSTSAIAQDPVKQAQELRQAPMKLIGNNFGFMTGMLKGEIPWDATEFTKRGKELAALGQLDLSRGYMAGSYKGHTRAKPDISDNMSDFREKMTAFEGDLRNLSGALSDTDALKGAVKDLAENCKACHKKYKNRDYEG